VFWTIISWLKTELLRFYFMYRAPSLWKVKDIYKAHSLIVNHNWQKEKDI